jgi:hypothetical protein
MLEAGNGLVDKMLMAIGRGDLPGSLHDGRRKDDLVVFRFVLLDGGGFDCERGFGLDVSALCPPLLPIVTGVARFRLFGQGRPLIVGPHLAGA